MFRKRLILILVACIMLLIPLLTSVACKAPAAEKTSAPEVEMPKFLLVCGGTSPTSPFQVAGRIIMEALAEHYPKVGTRHLPGAAGDALLKLAAKEVDIAINDTPNLRMGYHGEGFAKERPLTELRVIAAFQLPYRILGWVKPDSPIQGFKDFLGKRLSPADNPNAGSRYYVENACKANGFNFEDIIKAGGAIIYGAPDDGVSMVVTGAIDAAVFGTFHPSGDLTAVLAQNPLRPIGFTQKEIDYLAKAMPGYVPIEFPANYYKGQVGGPVTSLASTHQIVVRDDMPDDVVYNILAVVFEDNGRRFDEIPAWKGTTDWIANGLKVVSAPVHPGAVRFWREVHGIEVSKELYLKK